MGDETVDPRKQQAALKKEIEDFSEKKNREKRLAEQREAAAVIRAARLTEQAKEDQRAWIEAGPARNKQNAKKEAALAESDRLNTALVAEGVKAYDSWMTGTLQLIASFVQDSRALHETFQPLEKLTNLLVNAPWALGKGLEMLDDATRSTREGMADKLGINNRAIDRRFPEDNINLLDMITCNDHDGCLKINPKIEERDGFKFLNEKGNQDLKNRMNRFIKIATENLLREKGWESSPDSSDEKRTLWTRKDPEEESLSIVLQNTDLEQILKGPLPTNTMKELDIASREKYVKDNYEPPGFTP